MYAVPGSSLISSFSLLCRAIVLQRDGDKENPNFYSNLQCFAASLPIRLPKTHLESYPHAAGWPSRGEFFAVGARGWLVGWHGLEIAMRTRMGWTLRHQTRSWCGARLCGPLNISHPCSSPEQGHAGHPQPLIGSGRVGLAVRCRDNDVARGLAEACQISPANQATPGHVAVHSAASPSCFTFASLSATLPVRLVSNKEDAAIYCNPEGEKGKAA